MKSISYYLYLSFLYALALLPFPIFYLLCDLIFVLVYHVAGYRKKVVMSNLRNSFPEKSEKEIKKIARDFYRYLCDFMPEVFKTLVFNKHTALKHCYLTKEAIELFDSYYRQNKSLIIVMGHFGNWEWGGTAFNLSCKYKLQVIYHPLSNKAFNEIFNRMRTKYGTVLIEMQNTYREIRGKNNEPTATAFIADQAARAEYSYWTTFLNQDTPVYWGTERIARKTNFPVVYVSVFKIKRGVYEMRAETLFDNPGDTKEGEISEAHTRKLESDILKQPEIWLWSHRRWKNKRPASDQNSN